MSATDPLAAVPLELRPRIRSVARNLQTEFEGVFGNETVQRFMAESYDSLSGAKVKGFVPLLVERYTRQRLRALARVEGKTASDKPMVVFLCVHNAGRSQMAAGWMQHLAGDKVEVFSGGSDPASEVNPAAGLGLVAIILAFGAVSGGQLNPVITLVGFLSGGLAATAAIVYVVAQLAGAAVGAVVANVTFGLPAVELAERSRATGSLWASEVVATLGLVLVVFGLIRSGRTSAVPFAVGAYIAAAIMFTSSTSFANPAATIARSLSNTFAGIAPASVPMFVLAEIAGGLLGLMVVAALFPQSHSGST